ncbi:MAG TPA: hypothetical protein VNO86_03040 [Candidatus Binatia bacterium]|nr:hypothetical protein [Candidatus Binatia bacterium]
MLDRARAHAGTGATIRRRKLPTWTARAAAGAAILAMAVFLQLQGASASGPAEEAAIADLLQRSGLRCMQDRISLRVLPADIDTQVRAAGKAGWIGEGSIWVGDDVAAAAASLSGRAYVSAPGDVWISGVIDGRPTALRLIERKTPGGATVWLVVHRVTPVDCPAGEG